MAVQQSLWLRIEDIPKLPPGWEVLPTSEACIQLKPGRLYDDKSARERGQVPILNQAQTGYHGYHDDVPGVLASPGSPVVTFANHTCAIRLMKQPFSCIQNIFPKIGKAGVCDTVFFYYAAQGRVGLTDYKGHHPLFRQAYIPIPPLPVQRKIAAILSAYDDLIENNTRRIKILEEMAQMVYREWFVNFRFPGHENVRMVESELGLIPEGWQVMKLSALVETQYGITKSASESEIGPKFVRGTDINKTTYVDWATVPYCQADDTELARYELSIGDVLVIRMADPGKVAIVEKDIGAVFGSYLIRLKINSDRLSPYYLFYFLLSDRYQGYVTGASTGTTRKSASAGVITGIDAIVPPRELGVQFDRQVMMLRQMMNNSLDTNSNLCQTRDLLLPKLISGELDFSDLEVDVREEAS